jgi:hypothetical protein
MYDPAVMYIFILSEIVIIVILMYPVLNLTHMLNIPEKFSMGVTIWTFGCVFVTMTRPMQKYSTFHSGLISKTKTAG